MTEVEMKEAVFLNKIRIILDRSVFPTVKRNILHVSLILDGTCKGRYGDGGSDFQPIIDRLESKQKIVCRRKKGGTYISLPSV